MSHSAAINDRLRGMARERIDLLRTSAAAPADRLAAERLDEIDGQLSELLRRLSLIRAVLAGDFEQATAEVNE